MTRQSHRTKPCQPTTTEIPQPLDIMNTLIDIVALIEGIELHTNENHMHTKTLTFSVIAACQDENRPSKITKRTCNTTSPSFLYTHLENGYEHFLVELEVNLAGTTTYTSVRFGFLFLCTDNVAIVRRENINSAHWLHSKNDYDRIWFKYQAIHFFCWCFWCCLSCNLSLYSAAVDVECQQRPKN